ncbi:MAG: Ig-like domain-containing protein, partial [Candidatus Eremiobacterota bacterium]
MTRLRLLTLLLLTGLAWGCSDSANLANGGAGGAAPAPAPGTEATIVVRHTLTRAITPNITDLRFSGFDSAGNLVFGPLTLARIAEARVLVPVTVTRFQIEYLQGIVVVGIFTANVTLTPGGTFVIDDPAWTDVSGLLALAVTPADPTAPAGTAVQFVATGTFSDGSMQDLSGSVTWTSSNPTAATVNASGLANALAAGATTVTASLNSVSGSTTLNVTAATLASLAVTPAPLNMVSAQKQQLTATGTLTDGTTLDLTALVTWSSTNPAVVNLTPAGQAIALGLGSATLTASSGAVTGSTSATVTATGLVDFRATRAVSVGTAGEAVVAAESGDFDGDGIDDLVSSKTPNRISVRLSSTGAVVDTTLTAGLTAPTTALVVGRFNGDNVPDVALTGGAVNLGVYLGNPDGTLTLSMDVPDPGPALQLRVGEVNGDGRLDLVGSSGVAVETFLGNGDGTFALPPVA